MKKFNKLILMVLLMITSIISLCSFTNVEVGVINDNTTISNDLIELKLNPNDYVTYVENDNNSYLNEVYIIAIGENRISKTKTDIYIYFFNALKDYIWQNYYFNLFINNNKFSCALLHENDFTPYEDLYNYPDIMLTPCSYDDEKNITKAKFTYENNYTNREYKVESICRLTDELVYFNPFNATFTENVVDNKIETSFSYNSFIYITKDVLQRIRIKDYDVNSEWVKYLKEMWGGFWGPTTQTDLIFYNFSSSKKIDEILEIDATYKEERVLIQYGVQGSKETVLESKFYTKRNPKSLINGKIKQQIFGKEVLLNRFMTPSSKRVSEIGDAIKWDSKLEKVFNDYEHSVLLDITSFLNDTGVGKYENTETRISNFSLRRLKFKTNGVIYNSYVGDLDGSDNEVTPIIPETSKSPLERFIERLLEWIIAHPFESFMIALSLVVLMPVITSLLPLIIHSIVAVGGVIFKSLLLVIKLPFKLLIAFLKPPKKKDKS